MMSEYKCRINYGLYKNYFDKDVGGCDVSYELELPFVPYPKLAISFVGYNIVIKNVVWDHDNRVFYCPIEEQDIFCNARPLFNYEETKKLLLDNGWKITFEIEN